MVLSDSEWKSIVKKYLAAMITSALALQLAVSAARADDRYAKVCIKNETTADMKFSWRFGNDAWKQVDLTPGRQEIFWYEYAKVNADRSPYLYIRYDAKINGKKQESKQLRLNRAAGNDNCNQAKMHAFRVEPSDPNFITLFQTN
jgi:hypothetical protein